MLDVVEFEKRLNEWRMYRQARVSCAPVMRRARLELERCNRLERMIEWLSRRQQSGAEFVSVEILRNAFWSLRRHFKSDWDSIGIAFADPQETLLIRRLTAALPIVNRHRAVYERKCRKYRSEDESYTRWESGRGPFGKRAKGQ